MFAMLQFATFVLTTIFAVATAFGLHWLLLQAAFRLMQPATAQRVPIRAGLARGTAQVVRVYAGQR